MLKRPDGASFKGNMACLVLLPNNQFATADHASGEIFVWSKSENCNQYTCVQILKGHKHGWICMTYIGSNKLLSVADDEQLIIWDIPSGSLDLCKNLEYACTSLAIWKGQIVTCVDKKLYLSPKFVYEQDGESDA